MSDRFLKHTINGHIVLWQAHLAADPMLVEVADAKGTPLNVYEGEATVVEDEPVKKPRAKKAGLQAPVVADDDFDLDAELSADASRGA